MPTHRISLRALGLVLLGLLASLIISAPPADASSVVLCRGFVNCDAKSMGNDGYESVYQQMFWRMYGGHNCTNYMAYRMIQAGMPTERPWSSTGDASNWGVVYASKTNQTPLVGSVAWWSSNHVAYVEKIIDADTIVISEDHYGGDFDWRRIVRSGGGWPTGFIHLRDVRLAPTAPPVVTGTPTVDQPLAAAAGTWTKPATYRYQWLSAGTAITGATGSTYTPTADQLGRQLSVRIWASRAGYLTGTATSIAAPATAPGTLVPGAAPVISGIAKVGAVLSATAATWAPNPTGVSVSWLADGVPIPGASGPTLTLGAAQLGKVITVAATGTRAGYLTSRSVSAPTAKVGPEKLTVVREPTLSGRGYVGRTLTVDPGVVTPSGTTTSYIWLRDGVPIAGATGATYLIGDADPGSRISVQVSFTKPGYTTVQRTLALARPVQAFARIALFSTAPDQVTVTVRALGVDPVFGQVVLISPRGQQLTLTLRQGRADVAASWIRTGSRYFTVHYLGSHRVREGEISRRVDVR